MCCIILTYINSWHAPVVVQYSKIKLCKITLLGTENKSHSTLNFERSKEISFDFISIYSIFIPQKKIFEKWWKTTTFKYFLKSQTHNNTYKFIYFYLSRDFYPTEVDVRRILIEQLAANRITTELPHSSHLHSRYLRTVREVCTLPLYWRVSLFGCST